MYGNFSTCNIHYSMSTENSMVSDDYRYLIHEINIKLLTVFIKYTYIPILIWYLTYFFGRKKNIKKRVLYLMQNKTVSYSHSLNEITFTQKTLVDVDSLRVKIIVERPSTLKNRF